MFRWGNQMEFSATPRLYVRVENSIWMIIYHQLFTKHSSIAKKLSNDASHMIWYDQSDSDKKPLQDEVSYFYSYCRSIPLKPI